MPLATRIVSADADAGAVARLGRGVLRVPALALLVLLAGGAGVETLARSPAVAARLPAPRRMVGYPLFEHKLALADAVAARRPGRDLECIILGSSESFRGIDPVPLSEGFAAKTGRPLACFNFALPGTPLSSQDAVADVLFARYHPQVVIVGTVGLATYEAMRSRAERLIADDPWVRRLRGQVSIEGWLVERSRALGLLQGWLVARRPSATDEMADSNALGFGTGVRAMKRPHNAWFGLSREEKLALELAAAARKLARRTEHGVADRHLDALGAVAARLPRGGLAIVEMPVLDEATRAFDAWRDEMDESRRRLAALAADLGAPFVVGPGAAPVARGDFRDPIHLRAGGAEALSRWLGERLGEASAAGSFAGPRPPVGAGGDAP